MICCNGFFLGVELKAPNGRPSELQKYHIEMIKRSGGIGIILYPDGYEKFKKLIKFLKGYTAIGKDVVI